MIYLSLTIFATYSSIGTLIIAIFLYDKFGINAKFKEKQVFKVLDVAYFLVKMHISAETRGMTYLYNVLKPKTTFDYINKYVEFDSKKEVLFMMRL